MTTMEQSTKKEFSKIRFSKKKKKLQNYDYFFVFIVGLPLVIKNKIVIMIKRNILPVPLTLLC